jgi:transposase
MDNLSPHKSEVLFLPDFNPIEKMWSKIKVSLRSAQARTQPALIKRSLVVVRV